MNHFCLWMSLQGRVPIFCHWPFFIEAGDNTLSELLLSSFQHCLFSGMAWQHFQGKDWETRSRSRKDNLSLLTPRQVFPSLPACNTLWSHAGGDVARGAHQEQRQTCFPTRMRVLKRQGRSVPTPRTQLVGSRSLGSIYRGREGVNESVLFLE